MKLWQKKLVCVALKMITIFCLFFLLGTPGALELGDIGCGQCIIQLAVFGGLVALFGRWAINADMNIEREENKK